MGGRTNAFANSCVLQEQVQASHDDERCKHDVGLGNGYGQVLAHSPEATEDGIGDPGISGIDEFDGICDDDAQAKGDQERDQVRPFNHPINQDPLQNITKQKHDRHHHRECQEWFPAILFVQDPGQVGAHHDQFAMGQINNSHDPPNDRKTKHHHTIIAS